MKNKKKGSLPIGRCPSRGALVWWLCPLGWIKLPLFFSLSLSDLDFCFFVFFWELAYFSTRMVYAYWFHSNFQRSQGTPKEGLLYSSSSGDYLFKSSAPAIAAPRLLLLLLLQLGLAFTFQHQRQPAHLIICLAYSFGQKFIDLSRRRIFWGFFFDFLGLSISFSTLAYSLFFCSISSRQSGSIYRRFRMLAIVCPRHWASVIKCYRR